MPIPRPPLTALSYERRIVLPDERVAVCGDWHGNQAWVRTLARALPTLAPDVTTVLQLGDWWMDPVAPDEAFVDTSITKIYVTLGNHEPWGDIMRLQGAYPGAAVQVSKITGCSRVQLDCESAAALSSPSGARHPSTSTGGVKASPGGPTRTSLTSMSRRLLLEEMRT